MKENKPTLAERRGSTSSDPMCYKGEDLRLMKKRGASYKKVGKGE